ncbi:BspA family leucine-rich repeat surface protein [Aquimarina sediminis]|uniref:BspA family leucine-rich repeat surface protein n=1 Tax=Aquimarina sediminis TaxID=2070536 RepID=UPI000CA05F2F|nr:BspA family leucine-rich repeat surface protein [Aquimarina sediminis]
MMKLKQIKGDITILLLMIILSVGCNNDDDIQPTVSPDEPPVVNTAPEINAQTFTVKEDITDDVLIGKVVATDVENDPLTFVLTKNNNDLFEMTKTGELSLVADKKLDFETTTTYTITVEVSDGTLKASVDITISVEDVIEAFITRWKTTTPYEIVTIGLNKDITYGFTIDWGDGTVEKNQTTTASHSYATVGTHKVAISGVFPMFRITEGANVLESIEQWGDNTWESFDGAFAGCVNMTYNAVDIPNLSKVTNMSDMFSGCAKFNADLNNWDVSTVTNMHQMFSNCTSFTIGLNGWDVSNVMDMESMFYRATSFNGDVSKWSVAKVTSMLGMFYGATAFNGDLSSWDVSSVEKMDYMFIGASSFNGDLSTWDTSNVTSVSSMFSGCGKFNADLSKWDVSKVTNMRSMFFGAISFDSDISDWDIQNVTTMDGMLDNTNLSTTHYDALLVKWSALPNLESNVTFGVEGLVYCNAYTERINLTDGKRWRIVGDISCPR